MEQTGRSETVTIFTGVPRSGTTLLGKLANHYLDVGAVNEGSFEFWLQEQAADESRLADDGFYEQFLQRLLDHEYFVLLLGEGFDQAKALADLRESIAERTLRGVALGVVRLSARHYGRSRLGHEDPRLIDNLDAVLGVFPECRIVHILRDPRDTSASILRFPWGANNVFVAALGWNKKVAHARQVGARLGAERYLEIRYEDLLRLPRETMTKLMTFVCGAVDQPKLEQYVHEMETNPRRGNSGTWRRKLTPGQVQLVEACARPQMVVYGYEPESSPRRVSLATHVFWALHHRAVQVRNILSGQLAMNGGSKLETGPEEVRYPGA